MRARLKRLRSDEIPDLANWRPPQPDDFAVRRFRIPPGEHEGRGPEVGGVVLAGEGVERRPEGAAGEAAHPARGDARRCPMKPTAYGQMMGALSIWPFRFA